MAAVWAIGEIADGKPTKLTLELATLARTLAEASGGEAKTVLVGEGAAGAAAGATAYVAKSSPTEALSEAVDAAADAEKFVVPAARKRTGAGAITRRQREILQHYADGLSTTTVAKRLGLGTETIRTHTKAALSRLGARDRAHAVAIGLRNSLIE